MLESTGHLNNTALHSAAENAKVKTFSGHLDMPFQGRGDERAYRQWPELELFKQQVSSTLFESQKRFCLSLCRGESPVHLAAGAPGSHGDIRQVTFHIQTLLVTAHRHVEMLLEHGANLRKDRTEDGSTAAYFAARSGSFEVVKYYYYNSLLEGLETLAGCQLPFDKS